MGLQAIAHGVAGTPQLDDGRACMHPCACVWWPVALCAPHQLRVEAREDVEVAQVREGVDEVEGRPRADVPLEALGGRTVHAPHAFVRIDLGAVLAPP